MQVTFTEGYYNIKGSPVNVAGLVFDLVEDYKVARDGTGYVTVNGASQPGFQSATSVSVASRTAMQLQVPYNPSEFLKEFQCFKH